MCNACIFFLVHKEVPLVSSEKLNLRAVFSLAKKSLSEVFLRSGEMAQLIKCFQVWAHAFSAAAAK